MWHVKGLLDSDCLFKDTISENLSKVDFMSSLMWGGPFKDYINLYS